MSIWTLAKNRFTQRRLTDLVLDSATLAAAQSASRNPARQSILQAKISGGSPTGILYISGTTPNGAETEALTFSGAGYKRTRKSFSAIDAAGITASGAMVTTSTVEIKAVGFGGGSQKAAGSVVTTGLPGAVTYGVPRWVVDTAGTSEKQHATILVPYAPQWSFTEGDYLVDEHSSEEWRVEGYKLLRGGLLPHHWEIHAILKQGGVPA